MIKYLILIVLILESGSSLAQKNKKPKVYENDVFSISIPHGWKKYQDILKEETVVFQMAPKREIDRRLYEKSNNRVILKSKESSSSTSREGEFSYVKLDISEEPLKYENLEAFIEYRMSRFAIRKNKFQGESQTIYEEADNHYVEILKLKNIGSADLMYHMMHVKSHNGKLYMIIFSSPEEKLEKYINEVKQAFESFKFQAS
jgi:hypothetical protein